MLKTSKTRSLIFELQDELAAQLDDLREQMHGVLETGTAQSPSAAPATEQRRAGGNPIKHVITGLRLARFLGRMVYPSHSSALQDEQL